MSKYHREYKKLYDTSRWRKLRRLQLASEPLCEICKTKGLITPAEVVHHIKPHKGDINIFFTSKLQSLCKLCHDIITGHDEQKGYQKDIGTDGWPTDDKHPVNTYRCSHT